MADKDLRVLIDADAAKFEAGIERARRATMRMETQLRQADLAAAQLDKQLEDEAANAARKRADAMEKLGRGLVTFGAATLAGLGMAAKAAIDWESAWAGVRKTVDGSPEQLAQLETELRDLANTLPATHAEIAGVAEAAGQLGIATEDVSAFTKVMIDLGETTNLTAEEAATSIAQLMNIMQTAPDDVDNLGAALVDLGNNGASTEKDILELSLRLAAAGAQVGMSESEVLGLANAMASLGIEAEAGGSAMSRVMADMAKSVSQGGDKLEGFAKIAGVSAEEFARAFREDPAAAIATFTEGLGRIQASGGDVFTALDQVGLGSIRVRDALLRLAGGGDLLRESLDRGATAWEDNSALAEEAAKRYDTTEAKILMARNSLVNMAIDVGGVVLPALAELAEGAADIFQWFSDLPGPVKTVGTVLATAAGSASLLGGGFLLLAPRIKAARDLMADLGPTAQRTGRALGRLGRAAGIAGIVAALTGALIQLRYASDDAAPSVEGATKSLLDLANGNMDDSVRQLVDLKDQIAEISDRGLLEGLADQIFTVDGAFDDVKAIDEYKAKLESFDTALASMVQSGAMEKAEEAARALQEALGFDNAKFRDFLNSQLPQYAEALQGVDNDQRLAEGSAEGLAGGLDAAGGAADEAKTEIEKYLDAVKKATDPVFALNDALVSVEDAQSAYNDAVEEYGKESPEARQAAIDLMGAVGDLEAAALSGELSFEDFETKLDQWVKQGHITQDEAVAIKQRVKELRGEAEDYEGTYTAQVEAEKEEEAQRKIRQTQDRAEEFERRYEAKLDGDKRGADLALGGAERRADRWGRTRRSATVGVTDRASGGIRNILDLIRNVRSKTVTITARTVFSGGPRSPQMRASGGPVDAGRAYIVGEEGPELFRSSVPGQIIPATETARILSSAAVSSTQVLAPMGGSSGIDMGPREINVYVTQAAADPRETAAAVVRYLTFKGLS